MSGNNTEQATLTRAKQKIWTVVRCTDKRPEDMTATDWLKMSGVGHTILTRIFELIRRGICVGPPCEYHLLDGIECASPGDECEFWVERKDVAKMAADLAEDPAVEMRVLRQINANLQHDLAAAQRELAGLRKKQEIDQRQCDEMTSEACKMAEELAAAQREIEVLRGELAGAMKSCEQWEQDADALEAENIRLTAEIAKIAALPDQPAGLRKVGDYAEIAQAALAGAGETEKEEA